MTNWCDDPNCPANQLGLGVQHGVGGSVEGYDPIGRLAKKIECKYYKPHKTNEEIKIRYAIFLAGILAGMFLSLMVLAVME